MSHVATNPWTVAEFFAWQENQPDRYELVGGFPVRMMAGAKNLHDDVVVNLVAELRDQLRGKPCRPFTGDSAVETLPGQIRRPDAGVDCGRRDPDAMKAAMPRMVAEILSPSTRDFDSFEKLGEYKSVQSITSILMIEPNAPEVWFWFRGEDGSWNDRVVKGLDQAVEMPEVGVVLRLADLYDGIEFRVRPRLVITEDDQSG